MQNSNVEQQYRVLSVIWFVLLFSQLMFLVVVFITRPEVFSFDFSKPLLGENPPVIIAFAVLAIVNLILSFVVENRAAAQAIADQKPQYIQTGLIVACALCEAISLLGLVLAFAFSYQYFFAWFALGILGIVLHFPQRGNLIAASYKK